MSWFECCSEIDKKKPRCTTRYFTLETVFGHYEKELYLNKLISLGYRTRYWSPNIIFDSILTPKLQLQD